MSAAAVESTRAEAFFHYSKKPLDVVRDAEAFDAETVTMGKPRGLWIAAASDESEHPDDWARWCRGEDCSSFIDGRRRYEIVLARDAKVLRIATADELRRFGREFGAVPDSMRGLRFGHRYETYPDWRRVAGKYDGIVIAPYQWECRLSDPETRWYYSWDCASGCIWRARAVASIREFPSPDAQQGGQT